MPKNNCPHSSDRQKPAIILVHGFRGSPVGLSEIAKDLRKQNYQVFMPAISPFAGAKKLSDYTPEAYAEFLMDYAKTNNLKKPILVGHSMGSIVVAAALSLYPQSFNRKAILLSPIANRPAAPFRLISPLSALLPRGVVDYITTKFLFVPHDRKLFRKTMEITHACSADHPPSKSEMFRSAKFSTKYCVGDFQLPQETLLLAGDQDRLVGKKNVCRLATNQHLETVFLPNCGHLHNYEKPHETAQAIINFLEN